MNNTFQPNKTKEVYLMLGRGHTVETMVGFLDELLVSKDYVFLNDDEEIHLLELTMLLEQYRI